MDEIREEVLKLKREELKARLKGVPFTPTNEEKSILEKWEAKMAKSTDDTPIVIPPAGQFATECINDDAQESFLDAKKESIVLSSQDMMKKKRDELRQKGIFDYRSKQITIPQGNHINRTVREQWILNETVKVLFDNDSLMIAYQGVNINDEGNMDDCSARLKQKREELRMRLLSNKKSPLNKEDDFPTIVIPKGGILVVHNEDKCEKD